MLHTKNKGVRIMSKKKVFIINISDVINCSNFFNNI